MNLNAAGLINDTAIFLVTDHNDTSPDFVSLDDSLDHLEDAVVIDMSHDEIFDVFSIDTHLDSNAFVSLDHDVFMTDFTDDNFAATIIDLDYYDNAHCV